MFAAYAHVHRTKQGDHVGTHTNVLKVTPPQENPGKRSKQRGKNKQIRKEKSKERFFFKTTFMLFIALREERIQTH